MARAGSANAMLCSAAGFGRWWLARDSGAAAPGCNNDWSTWGVGSRTQWDVTKTFYLGVEVLYEKMNSAQTVRRGGSAGGFATIAFGGATTNETTPATGRSPFALTATSCPDRLIEV